MSFSPKSIVLSIGMFLLTLVGSLYFVGLVVPGRGLEADGEMRFERRGHLEADRMMREELESLRELNENLERKVLELEQRMGPEGTPGVAPLQPATPVMPAMPREAAPKAGNALPKVQGLDESSREF